MFVVSHYVSCYQMMMSLLMSCYRWYLCCCRAINDDISVDVLLSMMMSLLMSCYQRWCFCCCCAINDNVSVVVVLSMNMFLLMSCYQRWCLCWCPAINEDFSVVDVLLSTMMSLLMSSYQWWCLCCCCMQQCKSATRTQLVCGEELNWSSMDEMLTSTREWLLLNRCELYWISF